MRLSIFRKLKIRSETWLRLGLGASYLHAGYQALMTGQLIWWQKITWPEFLTSVIFWLERLPTEAVVKFLGLIQLIIGALFLLFFLSPRTIRWATILVIIYLVGLISILIATAKDPLILMTEKGLPILLLLTSAVALYLLNRRR